MRMRWLLITLIVVTVASITGLWAAPGSRMTIPTVRERPAYVEGELLVQVTPGTTRADLETFCQGKNLEVTAPLLMANTYHIRIKDSRQVSEVVMDLKGSPIISYAGPNYYRYALATPNDTRFNEQWGYAKISMPNAWDIQKGKDIIVAVIDTGVSPTHPDLSSRLLSGYNGLDGSSNFTDDNGHGTHVAGTIAAVTDNGLGVAGVCWEGIKILPVKVLAASGGGTTQSVVNGINWAATTGQADVINLSLGSAFPDPLEEQAVTSAIQKGVVVVAAAGNESLRPASKAAVIYPAAYSGVIAVAATTVDDTVTFYSNAGPEVSVSAPGGAGIDEGDTPQAAATAILSTWWDATAGDGYIAINGTSMASPHVAGAAALLLSEGAAPNEVKGLLEQTAKDIEAPGKDDDTGFGRIDVFAALSQIGAIIVFEKPLQGEVLGYINPTVKARVDNFDEGTLKVYADADPSTDANAQPVDPSKYTYDTTTKKLTFPTSIDTIGRHFVIIEATKGTKVKRVRRNFFLAAHVQPAGRTMFSVPFVLAQGGIRPEDLLGTSSFTLFRYVPDPDDPLLAEYAKYVPGETDPQAPASLTPKRSAKDPLTQSYLHGVPIPQSSTVSPTMPAGLGFWLDLETGMDLPVLVDGSPIEDQAYSLPLESGWNQIGDPFTFPVDWSNVQVEYKGQSVTLSTAVSNGWISRTLYRFINGSYQGFNAPEGQFIPWEGHWVHSLVPYDPTFKVNLVIPPVPSTGAIRGEGSLTRASNMKRDAWKLQLSVRAGRLADANNYIGVGSGSADGPDLEDTRKPPMISPFVTLSFVRSDWGRAAGVYMEDIRSPITGGKTWDFHINTDLPNTDVVLTWPNISRIPGGFRFTLEDVDTGRKVFMGTQPSYTYNSGAKTGPRKFRITVRSSAAESLMITNLSVTPARGRGTVLSYTLTGDANVGVEVLTLTGKPVRKLPVSAQTGGTRSVVWDNRDRQGRSVPSGAYLLKVTAVSEDGQVVHAVQPANVK